MRGVCERWEWREVWWHGNSGGGSLAVFLGCWLLLLPAPCSSFAAPCSLCCCPVSSRLHLSQLTAAVDTSLSPYWGSISSLIQPCWESLLQDAGVRGPRSHFSLQKKEETWSIVKTLLGSFRCDAKPNVTESGISQGNSFTFPDLLCNSKKNSNNLSNEIIQFVLSRAAKVRVGNWICILHNCYVLLNTQSVSSRWWWRKQEQFQLILVAFTPRSRVDSVRWRWQHPACPSLLPHLTFSNKPNPLDIVNPLLTCGGE